MMAQMNREKPAYKYSPSMQMALERAQIAPKQISITSKVSVYEEQKRINNNSHDIPKRRR